ncbi:cysteine dioxygenase [Streptomyces zagrosensis]|uniref:Mannose-6-phosphate isomerase-like protein (Cupin superfamily) n=1 Tax=Streptomyces zagrosensis TaxID=1042984 RepID=A0A7W9QF20_9ACTN|nr:cysteine dioxygenase family protein [Streptomyces zagrosensis]MBB5939085.1 mannose-6-phosphate isomerase-like protein (cupin superfamily) [Streptomyces zagrosensis]
MNSDIQIAGDWLDIPHLLPPVPAHPSTVSGFAHLARAIAADRASWEPLVEYDATSRWYHRLRTGPGYEVWLLSWVPGQGSEAHDHGRSSGLFTVLHGRLTERTAHGQRALRPGAHHVIAPGYAHDIVNDSLEPAVSLHIYFPGLTEMPFHAVPGAQPATTAPALAAPVTAAPAAAMFGGAGG